MIWVPARLFLLGVLGYVALAPAFGRGQEAQPPAVIRGVQYLRGAVNALDTGESALVGLALIKADLPPGDPAVQTVLRKVMTRFSGSTYTPERSGGTEIYEAAVVVLFLANLDPVAHKPQIDSVAAFLSGSQKANGSWDYTHRNAGDTSISQYAVLGLWEAENAGASVAPSVWDRAARWFLSVQDAEGGWCYHRDEGMTDTVSMTAAGVGSLLICRRQLAPYRERSTAGGSTLLIPLADTTNSPGSFKPEVSVAGINAAANRGIAWISNRFNPAAGPIMGQSPYYGLYGIERIGALADRATLGSVDWFSRGLQFVNATQQASGSWNSSFGDQANTAWVLLFATKSTAKSIKKIEIKRLGAGTLIGGRDLPKDLTSLTIAGGRVLARPMNGAVEGMLAVLEDPRAENADSALAGLMSRYQSEGPKALRPFIDRFRKMLLDRDPGVRSTAAWALSRTGDLAVVPDLIAAIEEDADETVLAQARLGLQLISRKIDGFGPAPGASPEARKQAAARWRAWLQSARPPDQDAPTAPSPARRP